MSVMGCLKAICEGLAIRGESDRPIGLKQVSDVSNDDLLTQLSQPSLPLPSFKPTLSKSPPPKVAPAFAQLPPSNYSFQYYADAFRQGPMPKFPRRRPVL